jgi:hypothetical protein
MRPSIELFLSRGDAGQALARGLDVGALAEAGDAGGAGDAGPGGPAANGGARPVIHVDAGGDPNSLRDQGWGVIAPVGDAGDRLLALARPLIDQRAADQGREVPVYRVPPDMTAAQAAAWRDRKLVENQLDDAIPGYLLVLGRPDQVSFELQQVLATGLSVGRVGFDADAGYAAYIEKLLRSERAPARGPTRAVYFIARDGTPATELGRRLLIQPCIADAEQQRSAGRFAAAEIAAIEVDDPAGAADRLVEAAAAGPGVVFSCSHGEGAPRDGWGSPERRRARQGALCLGGGHRLEAEALVRAPFAPGGVWLMFACFGAGTPAHSAYHHWLARLATAGEHDGDLAQVLASLPAEGEPPFLAALPQAALANPDGPLAVIGHLDLAWSYGFCDLDKMSRGERHRRFHELVAQLVKGTRVGPALGGSLMRARNQVQGEIVIAADAAAAAGTEVAGTGSDSRDATRGGVNDAALPRHPPKGGHGQAPLLIDARLPLGHRWMVLQDLAGYLALGDPAARIAAAAPAGQRAAAPASVAEVRTAVAASAPAAAAPAPLLTAEVIQAAVHELLAGRATLDELAARHGVAPAEVAKWRRVYTDAGLRAVASFAASSSTR